MVSFVVDVFSVEGLAQKVKYPANHPYDQDDGPAQQLPGQEEHQDHQGYAQPHYS